MYIVLIGKMPKLSIKSNAIHVWLGRGYRSPADKALESHSLFGLRFSLIMVLFLLIFVAVLMITFFFIKLGAKPSPGCGRQFGWWWELF